MLVSDREWKFTKQKWKLKDQDVVCKFQEEFNNLPEIDANLILE